MQNIIFYLLYYNIVLGFSISLLICNYKSHYVHNKVPIKASMEKYITAQMSYYGVW